MLTAYAVRAGRTERGPLAADAVWIDLLNPTPEETAVTEQACGVTIPKDNRASSGFSSAGGALTMLINVVGKSEGPHPETQRITLIATKRQFITVRHADPHPFLRYSARALRDPSMLASGHAALLAFIDTVIERTGEILQDLMKEMDEVSRIVFWRADESDRAIARIGMQAALQRIGHMGEVASRVQQSLLSVEQLLDCYLAEAKSPQAESMRRDVASMAGHTTFLAQKVGFLLDATLGFISAEQNQIIKLFSIAAVILLPPTLVATVYGMNFHNMPEIAWRYGYPMALLLMAISAIIPYLYFRKKGWI